MWSLLPLFSTHKPTNNIPKEVNKKKIKIKMDSPFNRRINGNHTDYTSSLYHQPTNKPRKVVNIPVHYVGSELGRPESALMIQKVFRGYLVRKSLKKIAEIRAEVEEVEKAIGKEETLNSIRKEPRERVKIDERLTCLVLKLDSLRGVDPGVRDLRKFVIKKAISLQEGIDAITQQKEDKIVEEKGEREEELVASPAPETLNREAEEEEEEKGENGDWGTACLESSSKEDLEGGERKSSEMLERVMEENKKMMGMMVELFERNEVQTKLLSCLSQRVEQLERAFLCDMLLRKKKMMKKKKMVKAKRNGECDMCC